ncbi:MAG: haloacid dehalogenase, partial [Faecalibacterium prausnitzii]
MLKQLLKYGFDGVIASAGGDIRIGERVIYDCPMEMELAKEALAVLRKNGVYCTIECTSGSYKDMGFDTFLEEHAGEGANSEMLRWRRQMERELSIHPMSEYNGTDPIYKIVILSMRKEQLEEPVRVLGDRVKFCVQGEDSYGYINGELHGPQFDKGSGVRAVCEALSLSTEDSIAFGDSMNDVELIEAAGFGVAMGNAMPNVQARADYV